jgi:hypothetical protein
LKRKRPEFMHEEPPSWTRGWHHQNHANGRGKVHNHLRTHGNEGATEPSRDGPGPVGPSQPAGLAQSRGSVQPPFPCPRRIFNPKSLEVPPFTEEKAIRTERPSTS